MRKVSLSGPHFLTIMESMEAEVLWHAWYQITRSHCLPPRAIRRLHNSQEPKEGKQNQMNQVLLLLCPMINRVVT